MTKKTKRNVFNTNELDRLFLEDMNQNFWDRLFEPVIYDYDDKDNS